MVRHNLTTLLLCLVTLTATAAPKKKTNPVRVTDLRTERMANPMSVDTATPRVGWRIESQESGVMQTAYRLIVASTPEKANALEGDLWDTTVRSDQSQWVKYAGKALRSNTRCYWRVKVSTTNGESDWSETAMWNVGLLTESDWQGQWIGLDHAMPWDVEEEHSRLSADFTQTPAELLQIGLIVRFPVRKTGQKTGLRDIGNNDIRFRAQFPVPGRVVVRKAAIEPAVISHHRIDEHHCIFFPEKIDDRGGHIDLAG